MSFRLRQIIPTVTVAIAIASLGVSGVSASASDSVSGVQTVSWGNNLKGWDIVVGNHNDWELWTSLRSRSITSFGQSELSAANVEAQAVSVFRGRPSSMFYGPADTFIKYVADDLVAGWYRYLDIEADDEGVTKVRCGVQKRKMGNMYENFEDISCTLISTVANLPIRVDFEPLGEGPWKAQ